MIKRRNNGQKKCNTVVQIEKKREDKDIGNGAQVKQWIVP